MKSCKWQFDEPQTFKHIVMIKPHFVAVYRSSCRRSRKTWSNSDWVAWALKSDRWRWRGLWEQQAATALHPVSLGVNSIRCEWGIPPFIQGSLQLIKMLLDNTNPTLSLPVWKISNFIVQCGQLDICIKILQNASLSYKVCCSSELYLEISHEDDSWCHGNCQNNLP